MLVLAVPDLERKINMLLALLALVCFLVAAVWSAVTRSYTVALIALGLALWVLAGDSPIVIND
jgi:uncharacterized membrane protein